MTTDVNNFDPRFTVTLAALREAGACYGGYNKLVRSIQGKAFSMKDADREAYIHLRHDAEIPLLDILKSNGLDDALWVLHCILDADRDMRLFAVWCARQVEHLMEDQRSKDALNVAERFVNGEATDEERDAARNAAWDAAWPATRGAVWSARKAARAAAWGAARGAAWDAVWAARCAAGDAAGDAAEDAQKEMLKRMCLGAAPWQQAKIAA
ncbi:putative bacteriophage protein [Burkholderia pseudomallei]|nr:putative bacteriophage protein [Burkholderia pseudomallei]CAJ2808510.1 putative bacteriophage protein [Burkholderia pseudomallei]CAJ2871989.1 putative bacteriophage protein [Burkholderia pseudomallei]CAJ2911466.1 putative bacteriophage protein [Burkholderia pseudomallei]CAJ3377402.1 putative bacteriophage protein [Burkholderia pseudomallei]